MKNKGLIAAGLAALSTSVFAAPVTLSSGATLDLDGLTSDVAAVAPVLIGITVAIMGFLLVKKLLNQGK